MSTARAARRTRRHQVARAAAAALVIALVMAGAVSVAGFPGGDQSATSRGSATPPVDVQRDTDGDGLRDVVEEAGWRTRNDGVVVTDPVLADTDGDGLVDGQEAGGLADGANPSMAMYVGLSRADVADTDEDGIGDGDEYFADMDPRSVDTDDDGLLDQAELDFGSDPTLDNPDDDSYSDGEERDRRSDPYIYDLSRGESVVAFLTGATAGDWEWAARGAGLEDAELESPEYLAGQIASGFIAVGDLRDILASAASGDLIGAVSAAGGLAPMGGDTARTVSLLADFARRGARAMASVRNVVDRLPWSTSAKRSVVRKIFGDVSTLPLSLGTGPRVNTVYKGVGYVGITNDFARRTREHATAGRTFAPKAIVGASELTRGEARAIEEVCIVRSGLRADGGSLENLRHSISPSHPDYDAALAWAEAHLTRTGGTCPT